MRALSLSAITLPLLLVWIVSCQRSQGQSNQRENSAGRQSVAKPNANVALEWQAQCDQDHSVERVAEDPGKLTWVGPLRTTQQAAEQDAKVHRKLTLHNATVLASSAKRDEGKTICATLDEINAEIERRKNPLKQKTSNSRTKTAGPDMGGGTTFCLSVDEINAEVERRRVAKASSH